MSHHFLDLFEPANIDDVVALPDDDDGLHLQFRHRTVSGVSTEADNIEFPWIWTRLDHPALNGRPQAIVTVTPVGRMESSSIKDNPHAVGVIYRNDRWYIYNLDQQAMAVRADFHVAIHEARREE